MFAKLVTESITNGKITIAPTRLHTYTNEFIINDEAQIVIIIIIIILEVVIVVVVNVATTMEMVSTVTVTNQ